MPGTEREIKLSADADFTLPDLAVAGLTFIDHGSDVLDAVYLDTPALDLHRARYGLRHRIRSGTGGIWTLKGPSTRDGDALVRRETEVAGGAGAIPAEIAAALPGSVDVAALQPVLRLRTRRHRLLGVDADDRPLVEVVDDDVEVRDGEDVAEGFRELEVEILDAAGDEAARRVVDLLRRNGAGAPESSSKLARGLRAVGRI